MKILFVADLHGEDLWKKAIEKEYDLIIFLGDYFDSFHVPIKKQIENFKNLIDFGNSNKDKTVFLLGNHDIHYLLYDTPYFYTMRGSGFNEKLVVPINSLYNYNKYLFKVAWQKDNILVTHAGVLQKYYDLFLKEFHKNFSNFNIALFLNTLWEKKSGLLMKIGKSRGGYDNQGGIFWADMQELLEDPLQGYIQIVGHTPIKDIIDTNTNQNVFIYKENWNEKTRLIFIDCLIYRDDKEDNPLFFEMVIEDNVS